MRSNIAWIGLSLFSLLGVAAFTACGKTTDREVGSAYPVTGKQCDTPGDTAAAADGCNDCTCGNDNRWVCTDAACPVPGTDGGGQMQCTPGTSNDTVCPYWFCDSDGTKHWYAVECNPSSDACSPGDRKKVDCNDCLCSDDAIWACTDMACDLPLPVGCKEGDTKRERCNTCTCDAAGNWTCTDKACPPQCLPGETETTHAGCNGCKCNPDGFWDCWTGTCSPGIESCFEGTQEDVGCLLCKCTAEKGLDCSSDPCNVFPE